VDERNILTLITGGYEHRGMAAGRVDIDLESAYRSFSFDLTPSWPGESNPVRVYPGDSCDLLIGDDAVLRGWVDSVSVNAGGGPLTITGRSRTSDLADCSCIPADGRNSLSWKSQTVGEIATDLASPYGIDVIDKVGDTERIDFRAKVDETAYSAIERLARESQALVTDDAAGRLVLMRPGTTRGPAFILPGNIQSGATATHDASKRFTEYVVRGQTKGTDANYYTAQASRVVAFDDWSARKRVHTIVAERKMGYDQCNKRAIWEAVTRAGRAITCSLPVSSWRDESGALYAVGTLCYVEAVPLGIKGDMVLSSIGFAIDRQTMTATLGMTLPGMYAPEAERTKAAPTRPRVKPATTAPADGYWRGEV